MGRIWRCLPHPIPPSVFDYQFTRLRVITENSSSSPFFLLPSMSAGTLCYLQGLRLDGFPLSLFFPSPAMRTADLTSEFLFSGRFPFFPFSYSQHKPPDILVCGIRAYIFFLPLDQSTAGSPFPPPGCSFPGSKDVIPFRKHFPLGFFSYSEESDRLPPVPPFFSVSAVIPAPFFPERRRQETSFFSLLPGESCGSPLFFTPFTPEQE